MTYFLVLVLGKQVNRSYNAVTEQCDCSTQNDACDREAYTNQYSVMARIWARGFEPFGDHQG